MKRHILFCSTLLLQLADQALCSEGYVFDDSNRNGRKDAEEVGVPGIIVSSGTQVARTDDLGFFHFAASQNERVHIVLPNGWSVPLTADNRYQFYKSPREQLAIPLWETDAKEETVALILADTQTYNEGDVELLERSTVQTISRSGTHYDFGVVLGDVVNDELDLLPKVSSVLAKLDTPMYYVAGNHDIDLAADSQPAAIETFQSLFGPSDFAFESGPALFVGLNNVQFPVVLNEKTGYIGGLSEDQFTWLENLLKQYPEDTPVAILAHIPFFYENGSGPETFRREDRTRLFELLARFQKPILLTGHSHSQRHYFHGADEGWNGSDPLHEYNVGAACGCFWGGPLDDKGIPHSTMWDGTPPGFAILRATSEGFQTEYRTTRYDKDVQMNIHIPARIKQGQSWISFYANVFDGHDGWSVEAIFGDAHSVRMNRAPSWDPSYAEAFLAQNQEGAELAPKRLPDPKRSHHLWKGMIPSSLEAGVQTLTIKATAPDGRTFSSGKEFEVVP